MIYFHLKLNKTATAPRHHPLLLIKLRNRQGHKQRHAYTCTNTWAISLFLMERICIETNCVKTGWVTESRGTHADVDRNRNRVQLQTSCTNRGTHRENSQKLTSCIYRNRHHVRAKHNRNRQCGALNWSGSDQSVVANNTRRSSKVCGYRKEIRQHPTYSSKSAICYQ